MLGLSSGRRITGLLIILFQLHRISSRKPRVSGTEKSFLNGADKAIVTTILGSIPYRDLSIENKRVYAERHGYDLIIYERALSGKFWSNKKDKMFNKPLAIQESFRSQNYSWVWWLDADSLIMNDNIKLDELLPALGDRSDLVDVVFGGDAHAVLNAGSMLFRNSSWTTGLLKQLYSRQDDLSIPNVKDWHEQAILIHLYLTDPDVRDHTLVLPQRALNSYPANFKWGDFVIHFAGVGKQKHPLMLSFAEQKENHLLFEIPDS